jgi:hypothetical protein
MSSSQSGRLLRLDQADGERVVDVLARHLSLERSGHSAEWFLRYCERGIEDEMTFEVFGDAAVTLDDELYLRGPTQLFSDAENAALEAARAEIDSLRSEIEVRAKLADVAVEPGQRQRPSDLNRDQFAAAQAHGLAALERALAEIDDEARSAFDYLLYALDYVAWDYQRPEQSLRAARRYAIERLKHTLRLRESLPYTKAKSLGLFQIVAIDRIVRELAEIFRSESGLSRGGLLSVLLEPATVTARLNSSAAVH